MADWFYVRDGQRNGPVSLEHLKSLAWSGQVGPQDLVWTDSMTNWLAAGQATELSGAFPATPVSPIPAGGHSPAVLGYAAPSSDVAVLSERGLQMLVETRPWTRLIGIVFIVLACLAGLVTVAAPLLGVVGRAGPEMLFAMIAYGILTIVYGALGFYLNRYAGSIALLQRMRRSVDLDAALEAQKAFWRLAGIIIAIGLALWAVAMLIMLIGVVAR